MSALRLPQHLAEPAHVDSGEAHLKFDLLEEIDCALGHTERDVEQSLRALRDFDAGGGESVDRQPLLDAAARAVWRLVVQHEACDLTDHHALVQRYRIPAEVMARLGASR
ncbi:MAG: hypothetical protein JNL41_04875 [Phenylobacterium sp.]|uniref:DUF6665 family protein n=1 Tax=Phenylobacterium sp. TaxID=1871053 RepID=UPI001A56D48F|nr:DUF6665 family protein [Phenylobacterium sp.]MBL8553590.1 hypothetical protein [Phenylobacterium sp.]